MPLTPVVIVDNKRSKSVKANKPKVKEDKLGIADAGRPQPIKNKKS